MITLELISEAVFFHPDDPDDYGLVRAFRQDSGQLAVEVILPDALLGAVAQQMIAQRSVRLCREAAGLSRSGLAAALESFFAICREHGCTVNAGPDAWDRTLRTLAPSVN